MTQATQPEHVVDGTAVDVPDHQPAAAPVAAPVAQQPGVPQVRHLPAEVRVPTGMTVAAQSTAQDLVSRMDVIREAMEKAMKPGVDYGVIPGTSGKPTLLKPGAEKLGVLFQLDLQAVNEQTWGPGDHLTVTSRVTAFHAPTGQRLGNGEGVCSTRERKYGKRTASRVCPQCQKDTIIKGKQEFGGGWLCFAKKGGCGAKFADDDKQITGQPLGDVDNPDLPDMWNTVTKMAEKRGKIDAVLAATGASALFTQDVEDMVVPDGLPEPAAPAESQVVTPQYAKPAPDNVIGQTRRALAFLLQDDPDGDRVVQILQKVEADAKANEGGNGLPWIAGRAVMHVAAAIKSLMDTPHGQAEQPPPGVGVPLDAPPPPQEPPAAPVQGALPADRPPAGTVPMPNTEGMDPARAVGAMREAGCICKNPLAGSEGQHEECPLVGHGIPF